MTQPVMAVASLVVASKHGQAWWDHACSGIQHAAGELAEKVGCWVDSAGSSCSSWALGSGPMPEVA